MVARADALALYLMSSVSVLADAEVKMAAMEAEEEQSRLSLQRYTARARGMCRLRRRTVSTQARQALDGTSPSGCSVAEPIHLEICPAIIPQPIGV